MYKFKSTFERESQVLEQEIVKEVTPYYSTHLQKE